MIMRLLLLAGFCLLLTLAFHRAPTLAQTHSPTPRAEGDLKGLVLDPNDARVAGAQVRVENKEKLFETQTSDEGAFQLRVPSGEYQLTIQSGGFKPFVKKRVRIEADKTETINATLWPAPSTGTLKVK
jgi:hypothetical protein